MIAIEFEGFTNEIGVGIVTLDGTILSNMRHTYINPPGHGFLPQETTIHYLQHVLPLMTTVLQLLVLVQIQSYPYSYLINTWSLRDHSYLHL